jgi:hypothetical protein
MVIYFSAAHGVGSHGSWLLLSCMVFGIDWITVLPFGVKTTLSSR